MQKIKSFERLLITGDATFGETSALPSRPLREFTFCLMAVAGIGYVDYLTGFEIVVFSFYLLPIRFASVRLHLVGGIAVSLAAVLAWSVSDYCVGHHYPNGFVAVWNSLMRFASFLVVAWLSARNAQLFAEERAVAAKLRQAMSEIRLLEGLLPICANCKKIRDEKNEWNQIERYIMQRTDAQFTHSICPGCAAQWAKEAGIEEEMRA